MSLYFPSTISNPQYPLNIDFEDTSITSAFEDGSVQSRRKFTRSRDTFTVKWENMPKSEFDILVDFVKNKAKFKANSFYWTNPASLGTNTEDVRLVRIADITNVSLTQLNYYSVTLKLQEV